MQGSISMSYVYATKLLEHWKSIGCVNTNEKENLGEMKARANSH